MAAMSAAPAATTLTPPSSSHGNGYSWTISSGHSEHADPPNFDTRNAFSKVPYLPYNGDAGTFTSDMDAPPKRSDDDDGDFPASVEPPPKPRSIREDVATGDAAPDPHTTGRNGVAGDRTLKTKGSYGGDDDDSSKWIHRDKLARIENQELQAAGIILPKSRARSKSRRDPSLEKVNGPRHGGEQSASRSRKNSAAAAEPKTPSLDASTPPAWDLRLAEEIEAEDSGFWVPPANASSRIPVAKTSPLPIPVEQLERDLPMIRKRDHSPGEDASSISYPKTRARSASTKPSSTNRAMSPGRRAATDASPRRPAAGSRKTSATAKTTAAGRPKTRNGKDVVNGASTRPSTRSGERELSFGAVSARQPEGEPPWMISAYRPDPRLPPDQQLLPTVAKRLLQEKWEREGTFGTIYDKEFRPLTDEGFGTPPTASEPGQAAPDEEREKPDEWPLKAEARSPTSAHLPARTNSYSTIPKIQEKPNMSPLASPRSQMRQQSPVRVPEPEEDTKKGGCGCCVVM